MFHSPVAPCPTCAERTRAQAAARESLADLTPSQLEVVRLVAEGLTNNDVSVRLNRCPKTIRNALSNAFMAAGVSNRTQLARLVWDAEL